MLGKKSDQVGLEHIVRDAAKNGGGAICASPFQANGGGIENRRKNYIRSLLHAQRDDWTSELRLGFYRHTCGGKVLKGHQECADKYSIDR